MFACQHSSPSARIGWWRCPFAMGSASTRASGPLASGGASPPDSVPRPRCWSVGSRKRRAPIDRRLRQSCIRLGDDVVDHALQVIGALPDRELAIGPRAFLENALDVGDFLRGAEFIDFLRDEF